MMVETKHFVSFMVMAVGILIAIIAWVDRSTRLENERAESVCASLGGVRLDHVTQFGRYVSHDYVCVDRKLILSHD